MTFIAALSDDLFDLAPVAARPAARRRAPLAAQGVAACLALTVLTMPGAVVQARWSKLTLVAAFVQHRYLASHGV